MSARLCGAATPRDTMRCHARRTLRPRARSAGAYASSLKTAAVDRRDFGSFALKSSPLR